MLLQQSKESIPFPNEYTLTDNIVDKAFSEVLAWGTVYIMDIMNGYDISSL